MPTFAFTDEDTLGIELIDAQHRRFFEILGRLAVARELGPGRKAVLQALDAMVSYVDEHFSTEERCMLDFGYEGYEAHRKLHAGFVRKIMETDRNYRSGVPGLDDDLLSYLKDWFVAHIRHEDPKFVALFRANGM